MKPPKNTLKNLIGKIRCGRTTTEWRRIAEQQNRALNRTINDLQAKLEESEAEVRRLKSYSHFD